LKAITPFFDDFMNADGKGKLKVSNPSARVVDIDFYGFYLVGDDFYDIGIFSYVTSDKATTCMFVYSDSDVTVTGGANVSVSLKQGWNRVYLSSKITTKAPDGLKWNYKSFY
jgi:hypothetical protein